MNRYVITYIYKNTKLEFNIKAKNEKEAIKKLNSFLDYKANILDVKIGE